MITWSIALAYPSIVFLVLILALGTDAWRFCLLMILPVVLLMTITTLLRSRQYIVDWSTSARGLSLSYYDYFSLREAIIPAECVSVSIAQDPLSPFQGHHILRVYDKRGHVLVRQFSDKYWDLRKMQNVKEALTVLSQTHAPADL